MWIVYYSCKYYFYLLYTYENIDDKYIIHFYIILQLLKKYIKTIYKTIVFNININFYYRYNIIYI